MPRCRTTQKQSHCAQVFARRWHELAGPEVEGGLAAFRPVAASGRRSPAIVAAQVDLASLYARADEWAMAHRLTESQRSTLARLIHEAWGELDLHPRRRSAVDLDRSRVVLARQRLVSASRLLQRAQRTLAPELAKDDAATPSHRRPPRACLCHEDGE